MSALLAPLFAQLVTLGVADRTEVRYLEPSSYRYEGSTRPSARLQLAWPRLEVSFGYGASLSLLPLDSPDRELLVYHTAFVGMSYRIKRTTIAVTSSGSYGEVNFRALALGSAQPGRPQTNPTDDPTGQPKPDPNKPADPAGMPTTNNTQLQPRVVDGIVRYGVWSNALTVTQEVTRQFRIAGVTSYTMAGAIDSDARDDYPVTRGTSVGLTGTYVWAWSKRDTFVTLVGLQQAWSSNGNRVASLFGGESWVHRFDKNTTSTLGAGLSATRVPFGEFSAYSVYPTFNAALIHTTKVARGALSLTLSAYSAPALDPLRATLDPRLGSSGSVTWSRDRFSSRVGGGAAISIADSDNDNGAFNNFFASAGIGYRIATWAQADAGAAMAQQAYQGQTTIPLTYVAFAGLTIAVAAPIAGRKH